MNRIARIASKLKASFLPAIVFTAILSNPEASRAGLTLVSSSGTSTYAIYSTSTNFESPSFNSSGMLLYPGGGLPALQGIAGGTTTQSQSTSTLSPSLLTNSTTVAGSPNGYVPASFGSATTQIYSSSSGNQGGYTSQGGVYWANSTNLSDNLTPGSNQSSVSFSTATATFTNNTGNSVTLTPGGIMSVTGRLGSLTSSTYEAAGLFSTYTIFNPLTQTSATTNLDSIILAANGSGINIASKGNGPKEYASVSVTGNTLTGTGTSLSPIPIVLASGESITITSALTLISDPGSSFVINTTLPSDFPSDPSFLPDFGVYAASTNLSPVPEPSTFLLLGAGMTMVGFYSRAKRRRSATGA